MGISAREDLALFGNINHIPRYLSHYDSQIKERDEINRELWDAPNYYAWILIASGLILYRVMEMFYYNDGDEGVFNSPYKTLLNRLFSQDNFEEYEKEAIILFVKIRHLLVHKGFPNPHHKPSSGARDVANGRPFKYKDVWELTKKIRKPKIYPGLKSNFKIAMKAISRNENDVNHNFGCMQHTKVKNIKPNCLKNFKEDIKKNGLRKITEIFPLASKRIFGFISTIKSHGVKEMMEKIIKELLLWAGFYYIKLRDDFLGQKPCFLKIITYRIFLKSLEKLLNTFYLFYSGCKYLFYSECEQILQNVIAHYDEITELQYNKHSLKDAYKKLKILSLEEIMNSTIDQELDRLKQINKKEFPIT